MNWDRVEFNWQRFRGKVKQEWGRLTDDDLDRIAGRRERLVGRLRDSYGFSREDAERRVQIWEGRCRL